MTRAQGTRAHHRGNSDIHLHPNGKFLYAGIRSPGWNASNPRHDLNEQGSF